MPARAAVAASAASNLKDIEVAAGRGGGPFNFRGGPRIQTLVETIQQSSHAGAWKDVA
jgi:hypothetical protein